MEAASTWVLLLTLLLLLLLLALTLPRTPARGRLPPGPTPLPLLGNLLQLRPGALYSGLLRLSKTYGPVFTVHLGPRRRVVVLAGHDAVQEALGGQAEEFSGRGMLATLDKTFDGHALAAAISCDYSFPITSPAPTWPKGNGDISPLNSEAGGAEEG